MDAYASLLDESVTVPTAFVGGGTPTLLPTDLMERLEHISAYSLIVEEGTAFCRLYEQGLLHLPPEEDVEQMDSLAVTVCWAPPDTSGLR